MFYLLVNLFGKTNVSSRMLYLIVIMVFFCILIYKCHNFSETFHYNIHFLCVFDLFLICLLLNLQSYYPAIQFRNHINQFFVHSGNCDCIVHFFLTSFKTIVTDPLTSILLIIVTIKFLLYYLLNEISKIVTEII